MKMKLFSLAIILTLSLTALVLPQTAYAYGAKEAGASLLVPTTGQAMNGELGNRKTKIMAGIEVAAITTTAILGGVVGGPVVWAGVGPLIANHLWSATDAYRGAQNKRDPYMQQQMLEAQRTLDLSRQRRFDREQGDRSDLRDRMARVSEQYN